MPYIGEGTMPQIVQESTCGDILDSQRSSIREALDEITRDIGMAMRKAGLSFPVYLSVTNSGNALATVATPLNPTGADWRTASDIVCRIIERKIEYGPLCGRELTCAVANAPSLTVTEVACEPCRSVGVAESDGTSFGALVPAMRDTPVA